VQLTDFENAAFTVFVALLSRSILFFDLNLYIPISRFDENMSRAHARDALRKEKFYWRKIIKSCPQDKPFETVHDEYEEMTVQQIMCGSGSYVGLLPLVRTYLDIIKCDETTRERVERYLKLVELRVCGDLMTLASWLRRFVAIHPSYQKDSIVTSEICHDVLNACRDIEEGTLQATQLLGTFSPRESSAADGQTVEASSVLLRGSESRTLLDLDNATSCRQFWAKLHQYSKESSGSNPNST